MNPKFVYLFKVGVAISKLPSVLPGLKSPKVSKPVPIIKTCERPCNGKSPCIRVCRRCGAGKLNRNKIKSGFGCHYSLENHTLTTFWGNSTGT